MTDYPTVEIPRIKLPPPPESRGRGVLRAFGELLMTAGLVVLLFVFYEVYVTDWFSAAKQATATQRLQAAWANDRGTHVGFVDGQGMAMMYVPALGADYHFTIVQGTSQPDLAIGPGHYTGSARPGQPGNFAVAGHRVGKGAPFNDIDLIEPCDAIVVETAHNWFVYRMLPKEGQAANWQATHGSDPQCRGVRPLGGPYAGVYGQEIVSPAKGDEVAPVPHHTGISLSKGQQAALMTLTTCHPKFSDRERLIVHAILVKQWAKNPEKPHAVPPALKETS